MLHLCVGSSVPLSALSFYPKGRPTEARKLEMQAEAGNLFGILVISWTVNALTVVSEFSCVKDGLAAWVKKQAEEMKLASQPLSKGVLRVPNGEKRGQVFSFKKVAQLEDAQNRWEAAMEQRFPRRQLPSTGRQAQVQAQGSNHPEVRQQEFYLAEPQRQRQMEELQAILDWIETNATKDGWGCKKDTVAVEHETISVVRRALAKVQEDPEVPVPSVSATEDGRMDLSWRDASKTKRVFCTLTDFNVLFHSNQRGIVKLTGTVADKAEIFAVALRELLDDCF